MKGIASISNPATKRNRSFLFTALACSLFVSQSAIAAIIPTYDVTGTDATWTDTGGGVYTVPTNAEDFANEIFERPVEDDKWSDSGGTRTSTGEYWAYADLESGGWGIDETYLYAYWTVVGDYKDVGGTVTTVGLEGHYYFYADVGGSVLTFAVEVNDAIPLTDTYSSGGIKIWDGNGNSQVSGEGRTDSTNTVEVAVPLADILSEFGLTLSADDLANAYLGVAVSNPSGPADLFVKDNENFNSEESILYGGSGVEYDTMLLTAAVPVPAAVWLFGSGLLGLVGMARRKQSI